MRDDFDDSAKVCPPEVILPPIGPDVDDDSDDLRGTVGDNNQIT